MNKKINVLSLFDGISCGQIALERAGIPINQYFASEIDKYPIKVTQHNYPKTIQIGDVLQVHAQALPKIDLLTGGFCCQSFSLAGKGLNFNDPRGKLFFECVRLLQECKPEYFLFENVQMKKEYRDIISDLIGVEPIFINSNLFSAQNRPRLYWTNIPQDKNLILDKGLTFSNVLDKISEYEYWSDARMFKWYNREYIRKDTYKIVGLNDKSPCLTVRGGHGGSDEPKTFHDDKIRRFTPIEFERLQTLPDNYTSIIDSRNIRRGCVGNGWTVDVIVHILKGLKEYYETII